MTTRKSQKIHNADMLAKRLTGEAVISVSKWSDNTVIITVGWERIDLEFSMDTWEDFNLRYDWRDFS